MDIGPIRTNIPATKNVIYLNTGFSGPSPQGVKDAIDAMLDLENELGPTSKPVLATHREQKAATRAAFARMIGATPEEVVLTDNTTRGINITLNGLPWRPGDEIVTDDLEHGSGLVPSYQMRALHGVSVKIVPLGAMDSEGAIGEKLESAVTPRTRLLVLSHIMYSSGLRIPLAEIHRMAHRRGARVLVDGAQTLGHIDLDMKALDADYYAVPAHKWLLGPEGAGALYVRQELLSDLIPTAVSGHAALNYDQAGQFEPATESPEKFELTTSSAALLAGTAAAIEFIERAGGMREVEARNRTLAEYARHGLREVAGVRVFSPSAGPTSCGLVLFVPGDWEPRAFTDELWEREKIVCRSVAYPLAGVRLSVDFFNTEEELDKVIETVRFLVKSGAGK